MMIKSLTSYWNIQIIIIMGLAMLINACGNPLEEPSKLNKHTAHGKSTEVEIEKGIHGGRLLTQNNFTLELSIFETGVPPEFRAWVSLKGESLKPSEVDLKISLIRLGGGVDEINFKPLGDVLRGDTVVYEPHSFIVKIYALHNGIKYNWQYDNFEGRTKIEPAVAKALEINTEIAEPKVLQQTISVFGEVTPNKERVSHVSARFAGVIKSVLVSVGEVINKGKILASIESNGSLKRYSIKAPISGIITQRNANVGEQAGTQNLFTITDNTNVWVDLSLFPKDQRYVKVGASVSFVTTNNDQTFEGKIALINVLAETNQTIIARVIINNEKGLLIPGSFVNAKIKIAEIAVPLAVKRSGLQPFRDFTVVYALVGDEYEVRMLELGRQDDQWIEVLGGLQPGTRYVSENSYVIKADIEKSGASHDH